MVNINGKDWNSLAADDIQTAIAEQDFDESFYFEFKDDRVTTKNLPKKFLPSPIPLVVIFSLVCQTKSRLMDALSGMNKEFMQLFMIQLPQHHLLILKNSYATQKRYML